MSTRKSGKLKKFFADKGYGFVDAANGDLFFHVNDSAGLNVNALHDGVLLSYEESKDSRSGKAKAVNVAIED